MSHETTTTETTPADTEPIGVLAEFAGPAELIAAARAIREKGYRKVEAYSPFPVHGIDEALAAPKPLLPWVVLGAGLTGCVVGVLMQWYMNAFEAPIPFSGYEYGISGKPFWSLPANIPVTFELIILFSSFTAFLGMIAFNKLPKFSNPLFRNETFLRATNDKFFLLVDKKDPQFDIDGVTSACQEIGSTHVEVIDNEPRRADSRHFLHHRRRGGRGRAVAPVLHRLCTRWHQRDSPAIDLVGHGLPTKDESPNRHRFVCRRALDATASGRHRGSRADGWRLAVGVGHRA